MIGRAFYIMSMVEGRVLWDPSLPGMGIAERGAIYDEINRVIAAWHKVDVTAAGLADFGKPGSYFKRQISRWSKQYSASITQPIDEMDRLMAWLPAHLPASALDHSRAAVVHGDYRLDNLVFRPREPRVLAVLDWELSTLGHPLADFAYRCTAWHIPPGAFRSIGGLDHAALGIPLEGDYVASYKRRAGFTTPEALANAWNFYLAYNLFRIAAVLQGIAKRVQDGTASSANARNAASGVRPSAQLCWQFASLAATFS